MVADSPSLRNSLSRHGLVRSKAWFGVLAARPHADDAIYINHYSRPTNSWTNWASTEGSRSRATGKDRAINHCHALLHSSHNRAHLLTSFIPQCIRQSELNLIKQPHYWERATWIWMACDSDDPLDPYTENKMQSSLKLFITMGIWFFNGFLIRGESFSS